MVEAAYEFAGLEQALEERRLSVEAALRRLVREGRAPAVEAAVESSLFAPAKRLRPILALLVAEVLRGNPEAVLPAGCAIEMVHTASLILDLKGRLTAGLGDQILREAVDELLAEGRRRILLNLSEVSFVDSAGVGELVAGLKTARRFQAELKLLNVGERVYSTLDMARLLPTFEIYGDEAEAVASFAAEA